MSFKEDIAHKLQLLNLSHAWYNIFAYLLKPVNAFITLYQSKPANSAVYLLQKRIRYGKNFACAGGLWMSDFEEVKKNLIEPQARAYKLALSQLRKNVLPKSFLLSLSQAGAGGNGDWEAYRAAVNEVIFDDSVEERWGDSTARKLIDDLAEEYKVLKMDDKLDIFFESNESGLNLFLAKYLHYVIFGIDPSNEEHIKAIVKFHYELRSAAYHINVISQILFRKNEKEVKQALSKVAKIYEESPTISKLNENEERYKNMTKKELSLLMASIMSLAGMVGPQTLATIVLGNKGMPEYDGKKTGSIQVETIWDTIDLNNRDEVLRYMLECGRLRHPVSNTHKIAQEPFTAEVNGKNIKFPKGTLVYIPMQLASLDESIYGADTFEFNHNRENLCPFSTIFHSFGNETNGRICPGKAVAETMIADVLIALGKVRRGLEETKTVTKEVPKDAEDEAQKLELNCCGAGL